MSLLTQKFKFLRKAEKSLSGHQQIEQGGREWESFYRDRWSYDKTVRTTHGVLDDCGHPLPIHTLGSLLVLTVPIFDEGQYRVSSQRSIKG